MLTLYPSNKLEHLSFLLAILLDRQPAQGLSQDVILVESPGMQHWLSMELAAQRGIAMNIAYPLPVRFMWDTARAVLGDEAVPKESPFRRETLRWRIYGLLTSEAELAHPAMDRVNHFLVRSRDNGSGQLQSLQLAVALADLLEQYLLYRPDWLLAWERHESVLADDNDERWQAHIWRQLVKDTPYHPARLHEEMVTALQRTDTAKLKKSLPSRIVLFAINTMAPQFVAFLDALAMHVDVHLFHLNPCVNYWGNLSGRAEQARILREQGIEAWLTQSQDNPLLANLGRQGRDLFNQLTELQSYEISAFDLPAPDEQASPPTLLSSVQQDILQASVGSNDQCWHEDDNSILINSAHSTLREVQALHDYLLTQLAIDSSLQPRDVLVMCPAIEEYAPAIEAVFARVGVQRTENEMSPRIPCTIADRSPLDADPLVAAFLSLLSLPDSRFSVTQIVEYLSLPPLQRKFSLSEQSLTVIEYWLERANIHWGLDGTHKAQVSESATQSAMYSWQWGLQRLMLGMISEDAVQLLDNCVTIPDVEGQESVELGRLMLVIEQLQAHNRQLSQPRTAEQWQHYLNTLRDDCFTPGKEDIDSWESIGKAIADLALQCQQAGFTGELSLAEVRDILTKRFATPDAGNHFMTGQVTFCSMLPMRSIPFKIIAILGLNDGDFPRTNPPGSINMMARHPARLGDRSRRQEDRYLFLEALISAREALYLSFQGRSALNNAERQPSLVLQELMDFMHQAYQWQPDAVRQLPLHPFSPAVFKDSWPSYAGGWFRLAKRILTPVAEDPAQLLEISRQAPTLRQMSVTELARCFDDPLAWLAKQLGLRLELDNRLLEDSEPFETNKLSRYQFVDEVVANHHATTINEVTRQFLLSGDLPDSPLTRQELDQWQQAAALLAQVIPQQDEAHCQVNTSGENWQLYGSCYRQDDMLMSYHVGQHQIRRSLVAWLTMLTANAQGIDLPLTLYYVQWDKQPLALKSETFKPLGESEAKAQLSRFIAAINDIEQRPTLLHLAIAEVFYKFANMTDEDDDWLDSDQLERRWGGLIDTTDPYSKLGGSAYFNWFYPTAVPVSQVPLTRLAALYCGFLSHYKRSGKK
ncbi:exodeoxyribonuclease V subunit gamma [Alteromonas lipolytica]|uniref:RecBCD enzyme subunit RecC n=1 Tax=Alteromonas lipolytica TaxID=1856405 RepID=A0A1E8FG26_9ALTE|nr:exodeoxyribonuclease V subunit gamma [Alteromonas lipolytica]OFI34881.1 exodeoxyribonuclease V subunit gamma [Alteromonas lipolytica]GGF54789.1 RecBCD enzyme subunit RecC [Alteromonas lipolytica]